MFVLGDCLPAHVSASFGWVLSGFMGFRGGVVLTFGVCVRMRVLSLQNSHVETGVQKRRQ